MDPIGVVKLEDPVLENCFATSQRSTTADFRRTIHRGIITGAETASMLYACHMQSASPAEL